MRKHSSINIVSVIIAASCFFFSCGGHVIFNEFQPIKDKKWNKQDEISFHFEIMDNSIAYNVLLQLRNNDTYPYQNLWLLCDELQPSGISVKDTLEYMLADDFGKWTGNGITLFQNQMLLRSNYHFPDTGKYTINVHHGMRDDILKGIENVGLVIEKLK